MQESDEQRKARITANAKLFFSTWARKHAEEIKHTDFSEGHPAQELSVAKTEALMPEGPPGEFADRIRTILAMSFESEERAHAFFEALHRPYPYEGGNGRTYAEVLEQDYLSQGKGVAPLLGHVDEGLTDVPRTTGLIRSTLLADYGSKYLASVGEVASKTVAYETYQEQDVPLVLSPFGDVIYVSPQTDSVSEILQLSGLTQEDFDELSDVVNRQAALIIARDLSTKKVDADSDPNGQIPPGQVVVFSATGKRPDVVRDAEGNITGLEMNGISEVTAGLIGYAAATWPISIAGERIELGPIMSLDKLPAKEFPKEERRRHVLRQIEDTMDVVAGLTNKLLGKEVAHYKRVS